MTIPDIRLNDCNVTEEATGSNRVFWMHLLEISFFLLGLLAVVLAILVFVAGWNSFPKPVDGSSVQGSVILALLGFGFMLSSVVIYVIRKAANTK